jgi:hypothetical protein
VYTTNFQLPRDLGGRTHREPVTLIQQLLNDCSRRYPIDHFHVRESDDLINVTLFVITGDDTEAQLVGRLVSIDISILLNAGSGRG